MIICTNCETAQFLQIIQSRIYYEDGENPTEVKEKYECTLCYGTGEYEYKKGAKILSGDIRETDEKPLP